MTICSAGDRLRGWEGGYIYSIVHLLVHQYKVIDAFYQGLKDIIKTVYLYWIAQVFNRRTV